MINAVDIEHRRSGDTLDAIFCAYLACIAGGWGEERNEMFGTMAEGYIVVPKAADFAE